MPKSELDRLLAGRGIERVPADAAAAAASVEEATKHLASARAILATDANGAYQLLYDAARKAVAAHMLSRGYRARNVAGARATVAQYAAAALTAHTGSAKELDRLRRRRNRSEYGLAFFEPAEVGEALGHAEEIVRAVTEDLSARKS
jgi:hypothetical protein